MTHNLNRVLLLLLLLVGVPFYVLLIDNRPGNAPPKPLHIAALRRLAASTPGPAPTGIEVETIATRRIIGDIVAAGSGLRLHTIACLAWRLPVPERGAVMIDSTQTEKCAATLSMSNANPGSAARLKSANAQASILLQTHTHPYGSADTATDALGRNANSPPMPPVVTEGIVAKAVAPGVVVVPVPFQTPGSQLIYVRLENGQELLFTGGIASMTTNWTELRARSRLLSRYLADTNRPETYAWLRTIGQLAKESPAMLVVPGHDFEWAANQSAKRTISGHFSGEPAH